MRSWEEKGEQEEEEEEEGPLCGRCGGTQRKRGGVQEAVRFKKLQDDVVAAAVEVEEDWRWWRWRRG